MGLTPEDVRNKQFTTVRLREGYDEDEVDAFLDEIEAELARLLQENQELRLKLDSGSPAAAAPVAPAAPEVPPSAVAPMAPQTPGRKKRAPCVAASPSRQATSLPMLMAAMRSRPVTAPVMSA